ncbi:transmembrane protein 248-like [Schistocerca piceifrons]|uniref:transmembrane protein 248-like n=1 Tax=Schistocerca piceifrons TaxID=274613 RepID=UPI001F5EC735|nr:transmembrane protein 248-like [Schistocerca piceifrons]
MGLSYPLNNLKGFASSRPPLVVFTLCVTAFALTTLSLAYFIKNSDSVPNPDAAIDWPTFLRHLSSLDLCVLPDETTSVTHVTANSSGSPSTTTAIYDEQLSDSYGNVSIAVTASLSLREQLPQNVTFLSGSLPLSEWAQSCCTGEADSTFSGTTNLNVTVLLPPNAASVTANGSATNSREVCVTFSGPRSMLPAAQQSPPTCGSGGLSLYTASGGTARLVARSGDPAALGERVGDGWCAGGAQVRLSYRAGPGFSVTLTVRDRSLINLHLIHTSYFLFVMAMTLICYAIIKGKPKQKTIIIEKVPLDP